MRFLALFSGRVLARITAAVLQAVLLILLARELAPSLFGVFASAYGAGVLGASLLGFGASTRILRANAEADTALAGDLFRLRMFGAAIGSLAGAMVLPWAPSASVAVLVGVAFAAADAVIEFGQAYFASAEEHALSAGLPVALRVAQVGTVLAFARSSDTIIAVAASVTSAVVACACVILLLRSGLGRRTRQQYPGSLTQTARSSVGYWFAGVVANVRQLEPIVLLGAGSATLAAEYSIVTRIANPLLIVPATLQLIFVPRLSALLSDGHQFGVVMRRLWVVSALYCGLLVITSPVIAFCLPLVLGPDYEGAFPLAIAVVAATGLSSLSYVVQIRFITIGEPWRSSRWIAIYSLLGVGLLAALAGANGNMIWIVPLVTQALLFATLLLESGRSKGRSDTPPAT